jgi:hypothetical protein
VGGIKGTRATANPPELRQPLGKKKFACFYESCWRLAGLRDRGSGQFFRPQGSSSRTTAAQHSGLHIEHFPSYAAVLNPGEGVWSLAKRALADSCPNDVGELVEDVISTINAIRTSTQKLRGCILQSDCLFLALDYCIVYAEIRAWRAAAVLTSASGLAWVSPCRGCRRSRCGRWRSRGPGGARGRLLAWAKTETSG